MSATNIEAKLVSCLLTGNAQDRQTILRFPLTAEDFKSYDREYEFIRAFHERHHKWPDRSTFLASYPSFVILKTPEPVGHYASALIERRNRSKLVVEVRKMDGLLNSQNPGDVNKAITHIRETLDTMFLGDADPVLDMRARASDAFKAYKQKGIVQTSGKVYHSPYPTLNKMIPVGFRPENLITIMSRPSIGKTWELCNFGLKWWLENDANVLFISKEMTDEEIEERLHATYARLNWVNFQIGKLSSVQELAYSAALRKISQRKNWIRVLSDSKLSVSGGESLQAAIEMHKPDAVLVDGLAQMVSHDQRRGVAEQMMKLSQFMKRLAKSKKIVLMQSIHTNRTAEKEKKGGGMGAAAWSDQIMGDSDFVFELYSPDGDRKNQERIFSNVKGRNSGYGEFRKWMKVEPCIDLSEVASTNAAVTPKAQIIARGSKEAPSDVVEIEATIEE